MATTKKNAAKTAAPKQRSPKKGAPFFSEWKKDFLRRWHNSPSLYTLGTVVLIVIIATALLFIYNKSLFLAGSINGRFVTTPEFYSELVKSSGEEVFESIVRNSLIKQEATKKEVTVSEKEIDEKVKDLEDQIGGKEVLKSTLTQSGTSMDELREQIIIQIMVEKLLRDKIKVTDKEVQTYIKENQQAAATLTKEQVKETLKSQKLGEQFGPWFEELKKKAKINTFF
jgi:foldase protein PrsA